MTTDFIPGFAAITLIGAFGLGSRDQHVQTRPSRAGRDSREQPTPNWAHPTLHSLSRPRVVPSLVARSP